MNSTTCIFFGPHRDAPEEGTVPTVPFEVLACFESLRKQALRSVAFVVGFAPVLEAFEQLAA
jgi:hypothetical protein